MSKPNKTAQAAAEEIQQALRTSAPSTVELAVIISKHHKPVVEALEPFAKACTDAESDGCISGKAFRDFCEGFTIDKDFREAAAALAKLENTP